MLLKSIDTLVRDIRVGIRGLCRDWAFTGTAATSLILGIAAATAMFSVVHAVIIDPFPYRDVDHLMSIRVAEPGERFGRTYYSVDQYLEFRERSTIFSGVIASTISDVVWTGGGEPVRLRGNHGPFDTFEVMGVPALLGRTPTAADAVPGAPPVAVLGHRCWVRNFGADSGVLGRHLTLNGVTRQVIGVMPPRFMFRGADVYLPTHFRRGVAVEGVRFVHVLGRLKPGVTDEQAEADLRPVVAHLKEIDPKAFPEQWRAGLLSFKETFPSNIRNALWILFGATGLLILIACANVSNLLLSRAAGRQREMAVRAALGASRWRLTRQLLTESMVLAGVAGAAGIALAFVLLRLMISIVPPDTIPDEAEIVMNVPVLLFCAGISMLTAVVFGLAPAIQGWVSNLIEPLRAGTRSSGASRASSWMRSALVAGEVALSLVLLTGAVQMLRTLISLQSAEFGFPAERILAMRVPLPEESYPTPESRVNFQRELMERVRGLPGVSAVSVSNGMHPMRLWRLPVAFPDGRQSDQPVGFHQIDRGYFDVYGFGLLTGRPFTPADISARRQLTVVNEAFVRKHFDGSDALGKMIRIPALAEEPFRLAETGFEIVGVVRDVINQDPKEGVRPEIFVPYTILGRSELLVVRAAGDAYSLAKPVAAEVYALDSEQPVVDQRTVADFIQLWGLARPRFNSALFGVFAFLGLVLATIGVYGVISNQVARRTPEIGLRMALGASFADVMKMVLRGGLSLILAGLGIGMAGAFAAARYLASQMREFADFDPAAGALVAAILLAAGLLACLGPAFRAVRIDPAVALRNE